jgi:two-component system chemotaxis response regulator CheB
MPRIRVLVVDDAVVMRKLITESLARDPDIEVIGTAANGKIALQKITQVNPDIVTLDVEMPEMNGIETVRELRKTHPKLPVIMFSTLTRKGAEATLDAITAGATDYVTKPANVGSVSESINRLEQDLIPKIKTHSRVEIVPRSKVTASAPGELQTSRRLPARGKTVVRSGPPAPVEILCIGTSTGGPNALADVLTPLPKSFPVPIVIVQHMPPVFTALLAERLGKRCPLVFHEGSEGLAVKPGHVYIAPGGRHMEVCRQGSEVVIHLQDEPAENSCRPAVDVLFRSVARVFGGGTLAVVLTGMGADGARGCEHIRERGGQVIAQDAATSVVWGMPGAVTEAGLADQVLPLPEITSALLRATRCPGSAGSLPTERAA